MQERGSPVPVSGFGIICGDKAVPAPANCSCLGFTASDCLTSALRAQVAFALFDNLTWGAYEPYVGHFRSSARHVNTWDAKCAIVLMALAAAGKWRLHGFLQQTRFGNMIGPADIEQMTVEERLQAMELLWASLASKPQEIPSPAWRY